MIEYSDKVMHDFPQEGWDWEGGRVEGYDGCEKLFCGSLTFTRER